MLLHDDWRRRTHNSQQVAVPVDQLGMASGTRRKRPATRE